MTRQHVVWVDAAPVRAHVEQLVAAGLTKPQITRRSGVATHTITALLVGVHGRGPSQRVRRETAARLFAVEPELIGSEDQGWVDPIGTMRRLRSLLALGWPVKTMARMTGLPRNTFWPILDERVPVIRVSTRRKVIDLYEQLTRQPAPPPWMGATWARNRAARNAWPLPCVWSGGGIDDPEAHPIDADYPLPSHDSRCLRDLVAPETARQWAAVVEHLLEDDPGLSYEQIAARFDRAPTTVRDALRRAGRPDLQQRLASTRRRADPPSWAARVEDLLAVEPDTTLVAARQRLGADERLAAELVAAGRTDLRARLDRNTIRQQYRERR